MKGALFDLDDTLYDELSYVHSGFRAVADRLAARHDLDRGELFDQLTRDEERRGRGDNFDRLLARHDLTRRERVDDLVEVYRSHRPTLAFYDDVRPVLARLRSAGLGIGIVTDGLHRVQRTKLEALGASALADVIVCTDELGADRWKPHPAGFRQALQGLGVAPADAFYVGDNPVKDFAAPNALGMAAIQIVRPGKERAPAGDVSARITDLFELADWLGMEAT